MSRFKDKINNELGYLKATGTAQDIINKTESTNKVITFKKAVAMVAILVLVFTIIFIPSNNPKGSFVIIANAESTKSGATPDTNEVTGDVLDTENFVEISDGDSNVLTYNFNYVLDENADPADIAKKYLFHNFSKEIDIAIKGDDIETVTYKINNANLVGFIIKDSEKNEMTISSAGISNSKNQTDFTMNYDDHNYTHFVFGPPKEIKEDNESPSYKLLDTGELTTKTIVSNDPGDVVGIGVMDENTVVTKDEIEMLRKYAKNDDMVGFYNYQNQIFKRIIDSITLDITVTKTNGKTETQTLEFLYTPDILTEIIETDETNQNSPFFDCTATHSTGTLSAKIKK
ncbi:MAG: hypothetical protein IJO20_03055 [Ruminococcus sp.]|nr:hypothetical protein [Ruminococcus sp.]